MSADLPDQTDPFSTADLRESANAVITNQHARRRVLNAADEIESLRARLAQAEERYEVMRAERDAAMDEARHLARAANREAELPCCAAEAALATARRDALLEAADEWERLVVQGKPPIRGYQFLRARAALVVADTPEQEQG